MCWMFILLSENPVILDWTTSRLLRHWKVGASQRLTVAPAWLTPVSHRWTSNLTVVSPFSRTTTLMLLLWVRATGRTHTRWNPNRPVTPRKPRNGANHTKVRDVTSCCCLFHIIVSRTEAVLDQTKMPQCVIGLNKNICNVRSSKWKLLLSLRYM